MCARLEATPDLLGLSADPGLRRPAVVSMQGWQLLVADPVEELTTLEQLDHFAETAGWREPRVAGPPRPPLAVGYLTSDLSSRLLRLPEDPRPPVAPLPPISFGVYDWVVAVDPDGLGWVVAPPARLPGLQRWASSHPSPGATVPHTRPATAGLSPHEHRDAVNQILEWIAAGDLYQANLTFQVAVAWSGSPSELASRLAAATPAAAHAALIVGEDSAVVSASPETFLRVADGVLTTRPIKGTRPRFTDPRRDQDAAAALLASAKDHAEHVMIVDLERNDLGRVCQTGTVVVPEYAALERHPTVWHLTSTVQGRLRDDARLSDVVAATFPPGSVTGTPKRMAVSRTMLLEPVARGVYCGAVGVVGAGLLDLSVAIRTAVLHDGLASYGTGGGIVAESRPDDEYTEALAKAVAFLRATNGSLG